MRELEESRVLVLPVLIEDCDIPMFLREKLYADFRTDFEAGMKALIESLAKVTNLDQGRMKAGNTTTDWAETWSYDEDLFWVEYTLIEFSTEMPFTLLTMISVWCNEVITRRYRAYEEAGLGWLYRIIIGEALSDLAAEHDVKVLIEDQRPVMDKYKIRDPKLGAEYKVHIRCQRLGEDNGRDQLVNVGNYLRQICDYVRKLARKPTAEEAAALEKIWALFCVWNSCFRYFVFSRFSNSKDSRRASTMFMPCWAANILYSRRNASGTLKLRGTSTPAWDVSRLPSVSCIAGGSPLRAGGGTLAITRPSA